MKQKKFMDISRVKFSDEFTVSNVGGFEAGDIIQITEKLDGSNASIRYDVETGKLVAFSRKLELSEELRLKGFWDFVQKLNADDYKENPNYVIFGEWGTQHKVTYKPEFYENWYVYDIFDMEKHEYLPQTEVKKFAEEHGLIYIHVLYEGEFISWEHCKSFCNSPAYGELQEGIVIKNQTKLNNLCSKKPYVLKIVNERFSEVKNANQKKKAKSKKTKEKEHAQNIVDMIVTKRRVEKELSKMCEEGIIPEKITQEDMKLVAQNLPKRIYDDCIKEESELVQSAGELFGKTCASKVMDYVRKIIFCDL